MKKYCTRVIMIVLFFTVMGVGAVAGYIIGQSRTGADPTCTFYATVDSVDENNIIVQGLDINDINFRGRFSLTINNNTAIEWNHTPINVNDLKPGSRVSVTYSGPVTETEPAGISQVHNIILLEDQLDHSPRLVFRDAYITTNISYSGYGSSCRVFLDYADICSIWNVDALPGVYDDIEAIWKGSAQFNDEGSLELVEITAYNNPFDMNNQNLLCYITIRPGEMPLLTQMYNNNTPTCTLWGTPVTALDTGRYYQGIDYTVTGSAFCLRFMIPGDESAGVDAAFYAPDGRTQQTKALMNVLTGYCLDPENTFTLKSIKKKMPQPWETNTQFTQYIPDDFKEASDPGSYFTIEENYVSLRIITQDDINNQEICWTITRTFQPVDTVNLSNPETYDLRLKENIDTSDIGTLGLYGIVSDEEIETLKYPVFCVEDLTEDILRSRIFEKYQTFCKNPYMQLSVLYPDNMMITFSGHIQPKELLEIFKSLPTKK